MSQKQLQRVKVIEKVVDGHVTIAAAAELLDLSARQVKRLKRRYDPHSVAWVYHANRGKPPRNRIAEDTRRRVVTLARDKYRRFNDSHLQIGRAHV